MSVELELLAESSFFEQEMRVRLKNADRKMKIILFINQLITKVKYYGLVLKNFGLYQNMWCFTRISWVNTQITSFNKGKILHERKKRLDAIGFIWNAKK